MCKWACTIKYPILTDNKLVYKNVCVHWPWWRYLSIVESTLKYHIILWYIKWQSNSTMVYASWNRHCIMIHYHCSIWTWSIDVMGKSIHHPKHASHSLVLVPFSAVGCSKVPLAMPFICGQRIAEIMADLGSDGQYCRGIWSLHWRAHPSVCWLDTATSSDTSTSPPAPTGGSVIPESLTNTPGDTCRDYISIFEQFCWCIDEASFNGRALSSLFCMKVNMKCHS